MLIFFTNFSLMDFLVRHLALFCLFSSINGLDWFWIGSLCKNIQLMMLFFVAPFSLLWFFYHTSMTLLMMLSVMLLSMLMILLFTLNMIRHLIFWQQLELASELESERATVDWDRKGFVDFSAGKTQLVLFFQSNNSGVIDVKIDGSVLAGKWSCKMLGLSFLLN